MNAIQSNSNISSIRDNEPGPSLAKVFPLRNETRAYPGSASDEAGTTWLTKALVVFKGVLIVSAVVFVTITLALQSVARFS